MSKTSEQEEVSPPSKWFGEWMKERAFWREVTARALSGLIVLVVAFLVAFGFGYIRTPGGVMAGLTLILFINTITVFVFLALMYKHGALPGRDKGRAYNILITCFLAVMGFASIYVMWNITPVLPDVIEIIIRDAEKVEV